MDLELYFPGYHVVSLREIAPTRRDGLAVPKRQVSILGLRDLVLCRSLELGGDQALTVYGLDDYLFACDESERERARGVLREALRAPFLTDAINRGLRLVFVVRGELQVGQDGVVVVRPDDIHGRTALRQVFGKLERQDDAGGAHWFATDSISQ